MGTQVRRAIRYVLFVFPLVTTGCVGEAIQEAAQSARTAATQARTAATQTQTRNQLRQLGLLYHAYHDANRQGPPGWDEAKAFARQSSGTSQPLDELQKAGYIVAWGMRFRDVTIGISNFVLAYPPDGPQQGGVVVMMDGAVMLIPAEQLQAALQNQASIKPAAGAGGGPAASPPPGGGMGALPPAGGTGASVAGGMTQPPGRGPGSTPGFAGAAAAGFPASSAPPHAPSPAGRPAPGGGAPGTFPPGAFPPGASGGGTGAAGVVNLTGPGTGPVTGSTAVNVGDRLLAHWGSKWYDVTVLNVLPDGRIKVHWEGYSDSWDEAVERGRLRLSAPQSQPPVASSDPADGSSSATAAAPNESGAASRQEPFRLWTDASGQFQTEAQLVEVRGDQVTLKKRDGGLLTLPVEKLSAQDRLLLRTRRP